MYTDHLDHLTYWSIHQLVLFILKEYFRCFLFLANSVPNDIFQTYNC